MATDKYESVKIKKSIVNKVRVNKKKTGVNVCTFFEQAATEKLIKENVEFGSIRPLKTKS